MQAAEQNTLFTCPLVLTKKSVNPHTHNINTLIKPPSHFPNGSSDPIQHTCLLPLYHHSHDKWIPYEPAGLKEAVITPALIKPGLDDKVLSKFRPIPNLPFLSKILEKMFATQLQTHLDKNDLREPFQSGFRPLHSTETLLLATDSGVLGEPAAVH